MRDRSVLWLRCVTTSVTLVVLIHAIYGYSKIEKRVMTSTPCKTLIFGRDSLEPKSWTSLRMKLVDRIMLRMGLDVTFEHVEAKVFDEARVVINDQVLNDGLNCYSYHAFHSISILRDGSDSRVGVCLCAEPAVARQLFGNTLCEWIFLRSLVIVLVTYVALALTPCRCPDVRALIHWITKLPFGLCAHVDAQVVREVERERCEFCRKCVSRGHTLLIMVFGLLVYHYNFRITNRTNVLATTSIEDSRNLRRDLLGSELITSCYACAVFLVLRRCQFLTTVHLDCANVAISAIWVWRYCTLSARWYQYYSHLIWAFRLFQGITFGNFRLTLVLQTVVTIADVVNHSAHGTVGDMGPHAATSRTGAYFNGQVFSLFLSACITWTFEDLMKSEAIALLEARRSNREEKLVHRLLSVMCDAVVDLDSNLCMAQPCPKLASLMLRPQSVSTMLAQPFVDFVAPADRDRFIQYMTEEAAEQKVQQHENASETSRAQTSLIHVHLLSSNGGPFGVEVFTACIQNVDGCARYLVGIKEEEVSLSGQNLQYVNNTSAGGDIGSIPENSIFSNTRHSMSDSTCVLTPSVLGRSSSATSDDSSSSSASTGQEGDDLSCWVDAATSELKFLSCSSAFSIFRGPQGVGCGLEDCLEPASVDAFRNQLAEACDTSEEFSVPVLFKPQKHAQGSPSGILILGGGDLHELKGINVSPSSCPIQVRLVGMGPARTKSGKLLECNQRCMRMQIRVDDELTVMWYQSRPKVLKNLFQGGSSFRTVVENPLDFHDTVLAMAIKYICEGQPAMPIRLGNVTFKPVEHIRFLTPVADAQIVEIGVNSEDYTLATLSLEIRFEARPSVRIQL